MELAHTSYALKFKHPFGVSGNTRTETTSVFIQLSEGHLLGFGEACLPVYLGETIEDTISFLKRAKIILEGISLALPLEEVTKRINGVDPSYNAAKAAIDIALNDLFSKQAGKNFCEWKGIPKKDGVATSFTIGIDSEEMVIQKIKEAEQYSILKIKAGTKEDKDLIDLVRKHTNKPLYIDVNQGWTNKEYVIKMIEWMKDKNIILLEQPMPKAMHEEMKWVTERSPILTIADESIKRLADLEQMDGAFSGINIKLMKCTGLTEALKMIGFCKQNNIKILLGCMAESSCATSAMAQLMGFADYVDLDAPMLYKNDPFSGVRYQDGKLYLNDLPGIGVVPKENSLLI